MIGTIEERFHAKYIRAGPDECWLWTACTNGSGYGRFHPSPYHIVSAHILAWEIANDKDVPIGMWVLHTCDNPLCVNPRHLFIGTHQDNMDDMVAKGRRRGGNRKRPYRELLPPVNYNKDTDGPT